MDVIGLDSSDHIPHESFATNINTTDSADVIQCLQNSRLCLRVHASKEPNHTDDTFELNTLEALLERSAATHFDDVVHANSIGSQLASGLAPVGLSFVIDDVISAKLLELFGLLGRRSCRDNCRTGGFGELNGRISRVQSDGVEMGFGTNLQAKHTDTTRSLHENNLSGLQRLQAIQCIPTGERSAW